MFYFIQNKTFDEYIDKRMHKNIFMHSFILKIHTL